MAEDTTTPGPCSACGGQWIADLKYQHRTSCRRYNPETATTAADHERVSGLRDATPTESELINEQQYQQPVHAGDRYLISFVHTGGLHRRDVRIGTGAGDHEPAHRGRAADSTG